jgi:hypothetical protein
VRQLFNFGPEVPITVFEEDGTEITSNEYLLFLEKFTVLVIVPEIGTRSRLRNATNNNPESINKSYSLINFLKEFVHRPEVMKLLSPAELNVVTSFTNEHKLPGVS